MKLFRYEPKVEKFTGHVMLAIPTFVERLTYLKELGIEISNEGGEMKTNVKPSLEMLTKLLGKVVEIVKEVDLKYDDKIEIKSIYELQVYAEGLPVLMELATVLQNGISLGKT